jgi:hypothetical protein
MSETTLSISQNPFEPGWIEEGLYYRGNLPPESSEWADEDWIHLPHENYIPISKSRVLSAIQAEINEQIDPTQMKHFIQLLEGIYHFHYHRTLNELKEDFEYFTSSGESLRANISTDEIQRRETRFLYNFIQLMIRGNFNPLTENEQIHADLHSYLLDLPIDINWAIQDPGLIQNLLTHSETEAGKEILKESVGIDHLRDYLKIPTAYDDRILIFHRGVSPVSTSGLFIPQKLNRLVDRLFEFVLAPIHRRLEKRPQELISEVVATSREAVQGVVDHGKSVLQGRSLASSADDQNGKEREAVENDDVAFLPRWLRRTSLQNQSLALKNFVTSSQLQEPAFERVICLFRLYPPSPPPFLTRIPVVKKFVKTPPPGAIDNTIHIKLFQQIPMADLEIVFPEKRIKMKSFDKFMMGFLGFIGLVIGLAKGLSGDVGQEKGTLVVIFTVLALLIFKTIMRFINTRRRYMLQMSQDLYHKNLDNDIGVLQYLVDNIEDQEFKEAMMAYMLLLKAGKPISEKALDEDAENLLNRHFDGLEVDFEVDDALDKICVQVDKNGVEQLTDEQRNSTMFLPIVCAIEDADGETLYEAKPIEEALRIMDEKWDNFFEYNI